MGIDVTGDTVIVHNLYLITYVPFLCPKFGLLTNALISPSIISLHYRFPFKDLHNVLTLHWAIAQCTVCINDSPTGSVFSLGCF